MPAFRDRLEAYPPDFQTASEEIQSDDGRTFDPESIIPGRAASKNAAKISH
jgi:hypothetical protein